ncbi:MAG: Trk potassium uptake system protein TrkH [uncultured Solirubrobacterales bacterium]|uniref:Trk potassium uptake system protein TrkH n=1 Tax=uncultured Solirubrobacterales bacterium TaxID=768556 RepID=A0A6J4TAW6_9ACTN|nr:MAG: Trk potassium uptake system protein TrkH [uncultured Solirubrobacterales bacterium]
MLGIRFGGRLGTMPLRARDGFFAVAATWVAAAIVGAAPFLLDGTFNRPIDALFESMSGFTTTGATLLDDVEGTPYAVLLWRSLTQWFGGVGIVVLVVAVAPAVGLASQRVFYAESSGVTPDRLTPRIADTAKIIWGIYLTLTALAFAAYLIAGMGAFDAVNHAFTTLATGGFSTKTASLAAFNSLTVELVAIIFMILAGVNFAFYWKALRGPTIWPQAAEVRVYLLVLVAGIVAVTASLALNAQEGELRDNLRGAAFTVTSVMTGTGYTTADFDRWNDFARWLLLLLMFVGGCAGSTAGGLKVIRVFLLGKIASQEIQHQLQPKAVQVLRTRGRVFGEDVRRGVLGFFYIYMGVAIVGTVMMLATGLDLVTALSSVAATLNVIGPGLGEVGASENYDAVSPAGRLVLSGLMIAGRLEVFTILVLLTPAFWRPSVA